MSFIYCFSNSNHYAHVDIRKIDNKAVRAVNTGIIILGGGLVKHHIYNANLMVRGQNNLFLSLCIWQPISLSVFFNFLVRNDNYSYDMC